MKAVNTIIKILVALAAIAGAVYVAATYGDKIVAWCKKLINCKCSCKVEVEVVEDSAEEAVEEAAAEEIAAEEVPAVAEADFEG